MTVVRCAAFSSGLSSYFPIRVRSFGEPSSFLWSNNCVDWEHSTSIDFDILEDLSLHDQACVEADRHGSYAKVEHQVIRDCLTRLNPLMTIQYLVHVGAFPLGIVRRRWLARSKNFYLQTRPFLPKN